MPLGGGTQLADSPGKLGYAILLMLLFVLRINAPSFMKFESVEHAPMQAAKEKLETEQRADAKLRKEASRRTAA